jgi:ATP-dependent helicase/nuclease subunit A
MSDLPLFDQPPAAPPDPDADARVFAVDPRNNVVLEASAGTGKTTVLVQRYVNLLKAGVEPSNILAITFTRKAATEMRDRIVAELKKAATLSEFDKSRWLAIRDRLGEISISTIDAFCLSLLREFPLEADLDPGFDMADETEVPRFIEEALDRSMRIFTAIAKDDPDVALVIAQLGAARTRAGLASLLDRRLVAWSALDRFLTRGPAHLHAADVCQRAATALLDVLDAAPGGLASLLADGPVLHPRYQLFLRQVERLRGHAALDAAAVRAVLDRISLHFLTQDGSPRRGGAINPYNASHYPSDAAAKRHRTTVFAIAPQVERVARQFARELNGVLSRGIRRMFAIALDQYRETLAARSALDFSDVLDRALTLLRRMDEFSQSRFRLESRYHHVLVDEFQDTSRAQWELVSLLVQSWGEGMGLATNPSIFIVGDRKQSIYRFRDAEVAVLQEAGRYIEGLRPGGGEARRAISRSFRALPELLEFVNEVSAAMAHPVSQRHAFTFGETDRFPPVPLHDRLRGPGLGLAVGESPEACAAAVADEIARLLRDDVVRDKVTGVTRAARPGDIAILFRSRTSHREFEAALERVRVPTYVYKGLGFFDADEIKDSCALLRYLAEPASDLRAAALLRSGIARISDAALAALAPNIAAALLEPQPADDRLDEMDARMLAHLRAQVPGWLAQVDRVPPADLFEQLLPQVAYAIEIRGPRRQQAWENLKKMRGLVRRIQNRGYATLARIADHIDSLSAGDESNAVLEAIDAVNLMTVHASKGLEFPIVFVVNMSRGATGFPRPVRVIVDGDDETPSVSIGPFVSDMDALEREREQHETRRLLYVAMTRARDRLYLSSALKDGRLRPGALSLAEVLPDSLKAVFTSASGSGETVEWSAPSGRMFTFRVCPAAESETAQAGMTPDPAEMRAAEEGPPTDVLAWPADRVPVESLRRITVTQWLEMEGEVDTEHSEGRGALTGALVHRLLQASSGGLLSLDDARRQIGTMIRPDERATTLDLEIVVESALEVWARLLDRDDLRHLFSRATVLAEVPFSIRHRTGADQNVLLRGTIDSLALTADGVTVIELKTGAPRPMHARQLALYVEAARRLFVGKTVTGVLVHA